MPLPPPAVNAEVIARHAPAAVPDVPDATRDAIVAIGKALEGAFTSISAAHDAHMANPLLPAMGNLKRSADYASKAMQGLSALIKPHEQALQEEITALDAKVNAPLKLPDAPGPNYSATAQDIRTHFANLTEEKRLTRAMKAVQENDTITLGALLNAPGYLSGMDHVDSKTGRDLQAVLREAYKATHFGADLKRLATLRKSQEMIANGLETISGHTSALHPHDKLAAAVTLDKKARDLTANAEKYV